MLDHIIIIPGVLVLTRTMFFILGLGVEDNEEQQTIASSFIMAEKFMKYP